MAETLPNVFSMADDDDFPALPRPGVQSVGGVTPSKVRGEEGGPAGSPFSFALKRARLEHPGGAELLRLLPQGLHV